MSSVYTIHRPGDSDNVVAVALSKGHTQTLAVAQFDCHCKEYPREPWELREQLAWHHCGEQGPATPAAIIARYAPIPTPDEVIARAKAQQLAAEWVEPAPEYLAAFAAAATRAQRVEIDRGFAITEVVVQVPQGLDLSALSAAREHVRAAGWGRRRGSDDRVDTWEHIG